MEIMVSEKGADGLLNVPLKDGSLWVEELRDGRLVLNLGGPRRSQDDLCRITFGAWGLDAGDG